jgi:osmotically-inducible protein OsmY
MDVLSDAMLTARVKTALILDPRIGAGRIDVDTTDGTVTLRGTAPNSAVVQLAEAVARGSGADRVVNKLVIDSPVAGQPETFIPSDFPGVTTPEGAPPGPSVSLEAAVEAALAADRRVNAYLVHVRIEDGTAYLEGRQETVMARAAAGEVAAHVPGIAAVVNDIEVIPSV